jgi:methylmalonyl-CoA epimerase
LKDSLVRFDTNSAFYLTYRITIDRIHMRQVEHIGIAVKNLSAAIPVYERLLNSKCYKTEKVESEKVNTAFFKTGETKIELLESMTEDGVIQKFIDKKGEGIHHIAFEVEDIYAEMERLKNEGFTLLNTSPKRGADNKLVCFLHPRDLHGVLIELCMSITMEGEE